MAKRKAKKKDECCGGSWGKWANCCGSDDNGFFGRALFIIGVLIALNSLGFLHGIATWVIVLIGIGFALMKF